MNNMCIAAYVPANISVKEETLRECFRNNPDGAGVMWSDGERVFIEKGFMKIDDFVAAFQKIPETVDRGFHCRIATAGKIDEGCCHPFPIVSDMKEMKKTKHVVDGAVMHNGVISWTTPTKGKAEWYSDTMNFISSILYPMQEKIHDVALHDLIERATTGNKFIIMTPSAVHLIGTFTQEGGVFYSNTTFRVSRVTTYNDGYYYGGNTGRNSHCNGNYSRISTRYSRKNNAIDAALPDTVTNAFWVVVDCKEKLKRDDIASAASILGLNVIEEDEVLVDGQNAVLLVLDRLPQVTTIAGYEWSLLTIKEDA